MNGVTLTEPISLSDLINTGSHFEINSDFDHDDNELFPNFAAGGGFDDEDYEEEPIDMNKNLSPWLSSFDELKLCMTKIPQYNIYKKVLTESITDECMPSDLAVKKIRCTFHYNAFWELEKNPFDSTYLRGEPKRFIMNEQEILPGIELAIRTMKTGEESQFIIDYDYLFGKMGCPPRAKPMANGLFVIKLLNITEIGDEHALSDLSEHDRRKFSIIIDKVKEVHLKGKDHFKNNNIGSATRSFENAIRSLEYCTLENESEQAEQQEFLLKLYTNLAVCYNKMNNPKRTCLMCNEIGRMSNINKNCKVLFLEGRALMKLGEFNRASVRLKQALQLEPNSNIIIQELKLLAEKQQQYSKNERDLWTRAFGSTDENKKNNNANSTTATNNATNNNKKNNTNIDPEMIVEVKKYLEEFKSNDNEKKMVLPDGLTNDEIEQINNLATDLSLNLRLSDDSHLKKSYTIYKK